MHLDLDPSLTLVTSGIAIVSNNAPKFLGLALVTSGDQEYEEYVSIFLFRNFHNLHPPFCSVRIKLVDFYTEFYP